MQNKIYIIILNYNGWADTLECLESVLRNNYLNYQCIIVDNDSPNHSMKYLKAWAEGKLDVWNPINCALKHLSFPPEKKPINYVFYTENEVLNKEINKEAEAKLNNSIIFIQSNENKGFAAGNNIGIKYAIKKNDFEYIWLLNNDTVIQSDTIVELVDYATKNKSDITGSAMYYFDSPKTIQAFGGHINRFFGTGSHILNKNEIKNKLDYVVGSSFLISKKCLERIGLLPEEYFLYYEEVDYCFNARNNNLKLAIATDSIVYHKEGATIGANNKDKNNKSELNESLSLKNRIQFSNKYLNNRFGLYLGLFISFLIRIKRLQLRRAFRIIKIGINCD
jgi:GT2 family glycosyltransferase